MSSEKQQSTLPLVSIITVSWNRKEDVSELVESLLKQTYKKKEIIVVDNASTDGTVEFLRKNYPNIRIIALKRNCGLHGGFNIGVAIAKGDIIVGVDHDCVLEDEHTIDKVVKCFMENSRLGIVAFKVCSYFSKEISWDNPLHLPNGDSRQGYPCIAYNGCGYAILKNVYVKAGGLDEQFFIYYGELDLTLRVIDMKYECRYFPEVVVLHKSSSPPTSSWYKKTIRRNWIWLTLKNFPLREIVKLMRLPFKALRKALNKNDGRSYKFTNSRGNYMPLFLDLLIEVLLGLPQILKKRGPISCETYTYYKIIAANGVNN
jgi:GT2 family glycosyltransferase